MNDWRIARQGDLTSCPFERSETLKAAYETITDFLSKAGWHTTVNLVSFAQEQGLCVATATVFDADEQIISLGHGKGGMEEAIVGGLWEAVEHYFSQAPRVLSPTYLLPARYVSRLGSVNNLACFEALETADAKVLSCKRFESFSDETYTFVPLFLFDIAYQEAVSMQKDTFDYTSVCRFCSNNGTAIGKTFEDAAVHAISELVERDALSLFLLKHYFDPAGDPYGTLIDPETLPIELLKLLNAARARLDRNIYVIDITSELGIPAFAAVAAETRGEEVTYYRGFGASVNAAHAVKRALAEIVQVFDLMTRYGGVRKKDLLRLEYCVVKGFPMIRECVELKIHPNRLSVGSWSYPKGEFVTPRDCLARLIDSLEKNGIDIWYHICHEVAQSLCVVTCASMTLERFFLADGGSIVGPGTRGREFLLRSKEEGENSLAPVAE